MAQTSREDVRYCGLMHVQVLERSILIEWNAPRGNTATAYELERSLDGHFFSLLTREPATPTQTRYWYFDRHAYIGNQYYRLAIVTPGGGRYWFGQPVHVVVKDDRMLIVKNKSHECRAVR